MFKFKFKFKVVDFLFVKNEEDRVISINRLTLILQT